jgi:hypothetical protein
MGAIAETIPLLTPYTFGPFQLSHRYVFPFGFSVHAETMLGTPRVCQHFSVPEILMLLSELASRIQSF